MKKSKSILRKNKSTLILGAVAVIALIVIGVLISYVINLKKQPVEPDPVIPLPPDTTVTVAMLREVIAPAAELTASGQLDEYTINFSWLA